jgi:hypothetical protein
MRIMLSISERVPTIVIANVDEDHKRRPPPTVIIVISAARTPCPISTMKDPAAVVVGRPTPWFITYPGPAIRGTPDPMTISIRRPIGIDIGDARARSPNPAVICRVIPVTIGVEIFGPPNVLIVILRVVSQTLRKILFAIADPVVDCIKIARDKFPIAGVVTFDDQFGSPAIA